MAFEGFRKGFSELSENQQYLYVAFILSIFLYGGYKIKMTNDNHNRVMEDHAVRLKFDSVDEMKASMGKKDWDYAERLIYANKLRELEIVQQDAINAINSHAINSLESIPKVNEVIDDRDNIDELHQQFGQEFRTALARVKEDRKNLENERLRRAQPVSSPSPAGPVSGADVMNELDQQRRSANQIRKRTAKKKTSKRSTKKSKKSRRIVKK